ncbi:ribosome maturation factor RimM [Candidatus Phycosocius spiralis]|uniref:Ribosome maturation factor RimM n=1 Tax=Candidatus Phycosocius spiralis TaxID=2815099 RepID=A0ABQ4PYM0_9PROT|nr:ribosome maturation factor RimM [Candidatus Phycosocius spiralis]
MVGAIAGAFGVHGEVRLRSFTEKPEAMINYAPFYDQVGNCVLTPRAWHPIKDGVVVSAPEIATREAAMAMRNTPLFVPRSRLPEVEEDEFYHVDLIGLRLEDMAGADLGRVKAVVTGPQDLLEIEATPGAKTSWFLPFTKALVPRVELANQKLIVEVPLGLIPMIGGLIDQPDGGKTKPHNTIKET